MRIYVLTALAGLACLAFALTAGYVHDLPPSQFYRDPVAVFSTNFAIGWLSHVGGALWFSAAAILLFAGSVLPGRERLPLLGLGVLTFGLGVDDLFLVHEGVFPYVGLPGELLYALYGIGFLAWLRLFRAQVARTRWGLLVAAGAFLGSSVAIDVAYDVLELDSEAAIVAEDAAKLAGILFWAVYGIETAYRAAVAALAAPVAVVPARASRPTDLQEVPSRQVVAAGTEARSSASR